MRASRRLNLIRACVYHGQNFQLLFAMIAAAGAGLFQPMLSPRVQRIHAAENVTERVGVVLNANADGEIHDQIRNLADMASAENLEGYLACFAKNRVRQLRKEAATTFVRHDVQLDLLDSHVIKTRGNRSEVAVKYRAVLSEWEYEVISLLTMTREDGYWKISSEKIQEFQIDGPSICTPSRYTCMGGTCRLAAR